MADDFDIQQSQTIVQLLAEEDARLIAYLDELWRRMMTKDCDIIDAGQIRRAAIRLGQLTQGEAGTDG